MLKRALLLSHSLEFNDAFNGDLLYTHMTIYERIRLDVPSYTILIEKHFFV